MTGFGGEAGRERIKPGVEIDLVKVVSSADRRPSRRSVPGVSCLTAGRINCKRRALVLLRQKPRYGASFCEEADSHPGWPLVITSRLPAGSWLAELAS